MQLRKTMVSGLVGFLLMAHSPGSALAQISEAMCATYDYTAHFGPIRDQGDKPICWAFATAGLFEEELCLRTPVTCGKTSLSPIDAARANFDFNSGYGPGMAIDSIVASGGLCPEEFAPLKDFGAESFNKKLERKYAVLQGKYQSLSCPMTKVEQFATQKNLSKTVDEILSMLPSYAQERGDVEKKLFSSLQGGETSDVVAAHLLIPKSCVTKRIAFDDVTQASFQFDVSDHPNFSASDKLEQISSVFESGRSLAISMCAQKYADSHPGSECETHILIANGLHWNKDQHRCEIHFKNSWGEGALLNGWTSADEVLPLVQAITYMNH